MATLTLRADLIDAAEAPQYPSPSLYPSSSLFPGDQTGLVAAVIRGPGGVAYDVVARLDASGGVSFTESVDALVLAALELVDETGVPILHT